MQQKWQVTLKDPLEHNGEIITEVGFRDIIEDDITKGWISFNKINSAGEDDLDTLFMVAGDIARTLSIKPKLGNNASNLTITNLNAIMMAFGEYQQKLGEVGNTEDDDTPSPLSYSAPQDAELP